LLVYYRAQVICWFWYRLTRYLLTKEVIITSATGLGNYHFFWVDKSSCQPYQKSLIVYYYMTINILDSDWTKHYFTLHFKMWLPLLKSAHEVNITFEHCSVYPKIVTGKVQVAYFENVSSDWSIFKEAVLLSNQRFPKNSL
jgi:hypothetical protein